MITTREAVQGSTAREAIAIETSTQRRARIRSDGPRYRHDRTSEPSAAAQYFPWFWGLDMSHLRSRN